MHEIVRYYRPSSERDVEAMYANEIERPADYERPFSFAEWYKRAKGVKHGYEFALYNAYLHSWRRSKDNQRKTLELIKADYIELLKTVLRYVDEKDNNFEIEEINWDSYLEVEQVIPVVAKKLKEICLYVQAKREAVKRSKLKYNMVGTELSPERLFHEYILKAFTQRDTYFRVNDSDLYAAFPQLKPVNIKLKIRVRELYDDTEYMDKDPDRDPSWYFGDKYDEDEIAKKFYADKGFNDKTSLMWLFKNGFNKISTSDSRFYTLNETLANGDGPLSEYVDESKDTLVDYYKFELTKKYMGTDLLVNEIEDKTQGVETEIEYNIRSGNNWIYLPSGENMFDFPDISMAPYPISGTSMVDADYGSGSDNYRDSDRLFIIYGNEIKGAWLKSVDYQWDYDQRMVAELIPSGTTTFKFPYPGYGIKAEGMTWSGPEWTNVNSEFLILDEVDRQETLKDYWKYEADFYIEPLSIQSLTLTDVAHASTDYFNADKITVYEDGIWDSEPDEVNHGSYKRAFLYKMDYTDLVIKNGMNYICWPLFTYNDNSEVAEIPSGFCKDTKLSDLVPSGDWDLMGAKAGTGLYDSDIIYKLDSRGGYPIECAYLRSKPLNDEMESDDLVGNVQPSLSIKVEPDQFTTFLWNDDATDADEVFKHIPHKKSCPYTRLEPFSFVDENPADEKENIDYHQWMKCDCGSIIYSPLGHKGDNVYGFKGMTDLIIEDDEDISDLKSSKIGWFKLDDSASVDVGWENGSWVTGDKNEPFQLKKNHKYRYYRNGIGYSGDDLANDVIPYMVCYYRHKNRRAASRFVWMEAVLDANGKWVEQGNESSMVIHAGDNLAYDHADTTYFCCTGDNAWNEKRDNIGFSMRCKLRRSVNNTERDVTYWAEASDGDDSITISKGVSKWGGDIKFVDGYIPNMQPKPSDISIKENYVVQYENVGGRIEWGEDLVIKRTKRDRRWCALDIEMPKTDLPIYEGNVKPDELVVSERKVLNEETGRYEDVDSDIEIRQFINGYRVILNYWAKTAFTWKQKIIDVGKRSSIDDDGGWGSVETIVAAQAPWANITNRHFPTVAAVPMASWFYTDSKWGGYFIPTHLGVPIALSKRITTEYVTDETGYPIFNDPMIWARDAGLSVPPHIIQKDEMQNRPVRVVKVDSEWLKSPIVMCENAGNITEPWQYEQFMPYRTRYEERRYNNIGIFRQSDSDDPWDGENDRRWTREEDYKKHFTKQRPIRKWVEDRKLFDKVQDWKVDIYGYSYALVKPDLGNDEYYSIYRKNNELTGRLVIRLKNNRICYLDDIITSLKSKITKKTNSPDELEGTVYGFDIIRNILLIDTETATLVYKIDYDHDLNWETYKDHNIIDHSGNLIVLNSIINGEREYYYAGSKRPSRKNEIYISRFRWCADPLKIYPKRLYLYIGKLKVDTFRFKERIYDEFDEFNSFMADSSRSRVDVEICKPVSSFDDDNEILNEVMQVRYSYNCPFERDYCKYVKCVNYDESHGRPHCTLTGPRRCGVGCIVTAKVDVVSYECKPTVVIPKRNMVTG